MNHIRLEVVQIAAIKMKSVRLGAVCPCLGLEGLAGRAWASTWQAQALSPRAGLSGLGRAGPGLGLEPQPSTSLKVGVSWVDTSKR